MRQCMVKRCHEKAQVDVFWPEDLSVSVDGNGLDDRDAHHLEVCEAHAAKLGDVTAWSGGRYVMMSLDRIVGWTIKVTWYDDSTAKIRLVEPRQKVER